MNNRRIISKAVQQAVFCEKIYHGCAQCVLGGIMDVFDIDEPATFRVATGLSGGMGCTGRTCGALTGGILAIGLFVGRDRSNMEDPQRNRWANFALVKRLIEKCEAKFGSLECRKVQEQVVGIGVDFWDPQDAKRFRSEYDGHTRCAEGVVGVVTEWASELILEHLEASDKVIN